MIYGCIAEHLGHSFSPEVHAHLGDYPYELCELAPDAVGDFLRRRAFAGINVTIPYKQTVIPYLDALDPIAAQTGAVNTIVCRDGKLRGFNTDYFGLQTLLRAASISLKNKRVAILGTGGTSRTARALAEDAGAARIVCVSRTPTGDAIGYPELLASAASWDVLINTTPVGMTPDDGEMPVDPALFPALCGVVDAVYHPLRTAFVLRAAARGIPAVGGLRMLVAQAAAAASLFFNDESYRMKIDAVTKQMLYEKENIVLIGMPGSGKSTLGRLLGKRLKREFFDADRVFEATLGIAPARFIEENGEPAFRREEARVLASLSRKNGIILATGGGAVTVPENLEHLRRNGRIVFLDRAPDDLHSFRNRPLTASPDALMAKYRERLPLYRAAADVTVAVYGEKQDSLAALLAAVRPPKGKR